MVKQKLAQDAKKPTNTVVNLLRVLGELLFQLTGVLRQLDFVAVAISRRRSWGHLPQDVFSMTRCFCKMQLVL